MTAHFGENVERFSAFVPLFDFVLDRSAQRQISAMIETVDFGRGEVLAREGEAGQALFVLSSGAVKLSKVLGTDRVQIVAFRGAGDIVGLHRGFTPWPVTVEAITAGSVQRLAWDDLRRLSRRHPQIDGALLDLAGDEIADLQEHLLTLGRKTTEEKIASFLLALSRSNGLQSHARREIRLPMRRTEIADYLGLTTASVSRELTRLKNQNIISLPRPSRVVLLNQTRLEAVASGARPQDNWPAPQTMLSAGANGSSSVTAR